MPSELVLFKCTNCGIYKGTNKPRNRCFGCWYLYFVVHPEDVSDIARLLTLGNARQAVAAHGSETVQQFHKYVTLKEKDKAIKEPDDDRSGTTDDASTD